MGGCVGAPGGGQDGTRASRLDAGQLAHEICPTSGQEREPRSFSFVAG